MSYFADVVGTGPVRCGQCPLVIGVSESQDSPMLVGEARCVGWTDKRLALWKLTVRGKEVPGRWIIFDRRFLKVQ
jgi:hypothetical protein